MEVAMAVYNLFDNSAIEQYSTQQGRRVTGTISYKF